MQRSVLQHLQAVALEVLTCAAHSPLYRGEGVAPEVHLITLPERLKQQLQLDFFCCIFDLCVHRGIHTLTRDRRGVWRERVWQYVEITVVGGHLKKKTKKMNEDSEYNKQTKS